MYIDCDVVGKLRVRQGIEEKYFFFGLTYILQFQFLKVCHLNVINSTINLERFNCFFVLHYGKMFP